MCVTDLGSWPGVWTLVFPHSGWPRIGPLWTPSLADQVCRASGGGVFPGCHQTLDKPSHPVCPASLGTLTQTSWKPVPLGPSLRAWARDAKPPVPPPGPVQTPGRARCGCPHQAPGARNHPDGRRLVAKCVPQARASACLRGSALPSRALLLEALSTPGPVLTTRQWPSWLATCYLQPGSGWEL